jgi:hypothetical protein
MFGEWIHHTDTLRAEFQTAVPYKHVIIDSFFDETYANLLADAFPTVDTSWVKYWNPIEKKFALNHFSNAPMFESLFQHLQSDSFLHTVRSATGISTLEADPYLHGAGLHYHPNGGKLDMHLDYSIHPITGKERRVNIILYLNKEWKEEWGGDLELWDAAFTGPVTTVTPTFNRAVLFQTNDISWHGIPHPIRCPDGVGRKSLAIYYVSPPESIQNIRLKAQFRNLPSMPYDARLEALYEYRKHNILTASVLEKLYPDWELCGNGYW